MKTIRLALSTSNARHKPRKIADEIKTAVFVGRIKPGDKLPSVREAAEEWKQTKDSVQRAYKLLRDEGVLVDSDDRGTLPWFMVNPNLQPPAEQERAARLEGLITQTLAAARKLGYSIEEVEEASQRVLVRVKQPKKRATRKAEPHASLN